MLEIIQEQLRIQKEQLARTQQQFIFLLGTIAALEDLLKQLDKPEEDTENAK